MKKTIPLFIFSLFFSVINAQTEIKRVGAISAKSSPNTNPENPVQNTIIPYNTICFEEKGSPEVIVVNKTNYNCLIKKFSSNADAEAFLANFKNSDSNISHCAFLENKSGMYSFSFTIKDPKETKWFLQLFQKNGLQFIKYNSEIKSIDELLAK